MPLTELKITLLKSFIVLFAWVLTVPMIFSTITSLIASLYFFSMIKNNMVDKNHNGSWRKYIKSLFTKKKK